MMCSRGPGSGKVQTVHKYWGFTMKNDTYLEAERLSASVITATTSKIGSIALSVAPLCSIKAPQSFPKQKDNTPHQDGTMTHILRLCRAVQQQGANQKTLWEEDAVGKTGTGGSTRTSHRDQSRRCDSDQESQGCPSLGVPSFGATELHPAREAARHCHRCEAPGCQRLLRQRPSQVRITLHREERIPTMGHPIAMAPQSHS